MSTATIRLGTRTRWLCPQEASTSRGECRVPSHALLLPRPLTARGRDHLRYKYKHSILPTPTGSLRDTPATGRQRVSIMIRVSFQAMGHSSVACRILRLCLTLHTLVGRIVCRRRYEAENHKSNHTRYLIGYIICGPVGSSDRLRCRSVQGQVQRSGLQNQTQHSGH